MPKKLHSTTLAPKRGKVTASASLRRAGAGLSAVSTMPAVEIGGTIRKRRRDMGLTLAQVGERSGFTTGYLSQLERDLATPSLLALASISQALGVELDYFLGTPHERGHHFPARNRDFFSLGREGMEYARISGEFPAHMLNALVVKVPPHYSSPEPMTLDGEELVYVIAGQLRYSMAERQFDLKAGDVVHLPSHLPHRWENPSNVESSVLWVGTNQIFSLGPKQGADGIATPSGAVASSAKGGKRAVPATRKKA